VIPEAAAQYILECGSRLSHSMLWSAQRAYFQRAGVDAWSANEVPHEITNNPRLAAAYAQVALAFIRDHGPSTGPFTVLELGAGTGRFGMLFLKAVIEEFDVADVPLRYVMSDFTPDRVEFWREHHALQSLVQAGLLDFAVVDVERFDTIELLESKAVLKAGALTDPLIVIANYVFDSVPQDVFSFRGGEVSECLLSVRANCPELDEAAPFTGIEVGFKRQPTTVDYYPEAELNAQLRRYADELEDSTVLFPVTALRALDKLAAISEQRMLLLTSDKGQLSLPALEGLNEPEIIAHGCFSMSVNYDAIHHWFEERGGTRLCTDRRRTLHTVACILGGPERPEHTERAYRLGIETVSPDDLFRVRRLVSSGALGIELADAMSIIRLSNYDPSVVYASVPVIAGEAHTLSPADRLELIDAVHRAFDNYFHMDEREDVPFELAALLHLVDDHAGAIRLFEASLRFYGEDPRTLWNLSICALANGQPEDAESHRARVWEVDPGFRSEEDLVLKEDEAPAS